MKEFFSLKRLAISLFIFLMSGGFSFVSVNWLVGEPSGPGSLGTAFTKLYGMVFAVIVIFVATRLLVARYFLGESSSADQGRAFLELILWLFILIIVALFLLI
jgi:hypothetical protein